MRSQDAFVKRSSLIVLMEYLLIVVGLLTNYYVDSDAKGRTSSYLKPCGNAGDFYIQSQLAKFFTKVAPEGIRGKVCDFGTAILSWCPNTRGLQGTHVAGIPKER